MSTSQTMPIATTPPTFPKGNAALTEVNSLSDQERRIVRCSRSDERLDTFCHDPTLWSSRSIGSV